MENNELYAINCVDEEEAAKECGYRNFLSFAAYEYYAEKNSLYISGKKIGISSTKMKSSLIKRGLRIRTRGRLPGKSPKKKREVDVWRLTRENTQYIFPWCVLYIYYEKYWLTSYEISSILNMSQPFVLKLLHSYGINVRKQGGFDEVERRMDERINNATEDAKIME